MTPHLEHRQLRQGTLSAHLAAFSPIDPIGRQQCSSRPTP
jgi:hypothetical protein